MPKGKRRLPFHSGMRMPRPKRYVFCGRNAPRDGFFPQERLYFTISRCQECYPALRARTYVRYNQCIRKKRGAKGEVLKKKYEFYFTIRGKMLSLHQHFEAAAAAELRKALCLDQAKAHGKSRREFRTSPNRRQEMFFRVRAQSQLARRTDANKFPPFDIFLFLFRFCRNAGCGKQGKAL